MLKYVCSAILYGLQAFFMEKRNKERGIFMKKGRLNLLALLTVFICLIMAVPVVAGQGNSSGGGQGNPLELASSTPADGDTGVALDTEIKLTFSKNVVNMQVKDINQGCFSFYADNRPVQVEVVMADDQIEPEYKRDIVLVPGEDLELNTNYTIKVAQELQSKSGSNLEKELTISFTTIGSESSESTVDPSNTGSESSSSTVDPSNDMDTEDTTEQAADKKEKSSNSTIIGIIAAVIAGGLIYVYIRRRK